MSLFISFTAGTTIASADVNSNFSAILTGNVDRTAGRIGNNNDIPITFGSSQNTSIAWNTTQTQPAMFFGLVSSFTFILGSEARKATNYGLAARSHPSLIIHDDSTSGPNYHEVMHDGTNAVNNAGAGSMAFQLAGTQKAILTTSAFNIASGSAYQINSTSVLNATTLGSGVTASSLTSLGTLAANLLFTDATYDIGASGATRPRDFYLSRNAVIGGTLGVTGATTLTGGFTSAALGNLTITDTTVNAATEVLRLSHTNSSGTPTTGMGASIKFGIPNASGQATLPAALDAVWSDATAGSEDADIVFRLEAAGAALAEKFRFSSTGVLNIASGGSYQINSASVLNATTLGSGVTASSLTSVGTLTGLTVNGSVTLGGTTGVAGVGIILKPAITASAGVGLGVGIGGETITAAADSDILAATVIGIAGVNTFATVTHTGLSASMLAIAGGNMAKTGSGTIDNAYSLRISSTPTIGTANWALYVSEGTTHLGGRLETTGLDTASTGTDIIIDGSNLIRPKTSSESTKINIRRRATPTREQVKKFLSLDPMLWNYPAYPDDDVLGFSAEELQATGLPNLINEKDGKPYSNRNEAMFAYLFSAVKMLMAEKAAA